MKNKVSMLGVMLVLILSCAISVMAQDQPAAGQSADQSKPAASEAKPAKSHGGEAAKPETLSGTISAVDADKHLVVVSGSDGVPYNLTVGKGTKITAGGSKAKLSDLQTGKQASVTFVAEKKHGNLARSIEVTQ